MKAEFNELELTAEQRLNALLCAYVLGELDGEERAEIEAQLATSETLRAERARLEATIGVVSGALHDGSKAELSRASTDALDAAVRRNSPTAWHRTVWARAAAAIVVIAGGAVLVREFQGAGPWPNSSRAPVLSDKSTGGDLIVADAQRTEATDTPKEVADEIEPAKREIAETESRSLKSAVVESPAPDPTTAQAAAKPGDIVGADFDSADSSEGAGLDVLGAKNERAEKLALAAKLRRLDEEAYDSRAKLPGLNEREGAAGKKDATVLHVAPTEAAPSAPVLGGEFAGTESKELAKSKFGRGEAKTGAPAPATPGAATGASPNKPASMGGPSKGSGGPSSPGPRSLDGGAIKGQSEFYLGRAEQDAVESLEELGYADGAYEVLGEDEFARPAARWESGDVDTEDDTKLGFVDRKARAQATQRAYDQRRLTLLERSCFPRPNETPRDMFFRFWGDNPFELTALDKLSTFSADVDTASYALARRYLISGNLPSKAQVRTEEFVNYFKGDVAPPSEGTFRVAMELVPSLFGETNDMWMMRVAVRGREVSKRERMPLALNFVIDVSGSMKEQNRLELVKHALRLLVGQLDARDTISIVKFSNDAALVLPPTSAKHHDLIESAIHPLQPEGSTNTEAGLRMGYAQASAALTKGSNNRVVLLTDGVANVGITDPNALVMMVESSRKQGVLLNTVGVGMNNHNDVLLEQLANKGDGICNYVDDDAEVRRALVDNFTGAFEAIARDVKIQVEFDPAQVERYRLLGYENRAVADADFRNAKVDAGEVGAGHQVVALYEIVRRGSANPDGPLATARVRWKAPYAQGVADSESNSSEIEIAEKFTARQASGGWAQASAGYRRSVLVAQFAEFLRRSVHARTDSLDRLIAEAELLAASMNDVEFNEFVALVKRSHALVIAETRRRDWFDDYADLIRHNRYLRQQIEDLRARTDTERRADELDTSVRDLEARLELLRRRVEGAEDALTREDLDRLAAENLQLQRRLLELLDEVARSQR